MATDELFGNRRLARAQHRRQPHKHRRARLLASLVVLGAVIAIIVLALSGTSAPSGSRSATGPTTKNTIGPNRAPTSSVPVAIASPTTTTTPSSTEPTSSTTAPSTEPTSTIAPTTSAEPATSPPPPAPIEVLNGTGAPGLAARAAAELSAIGYGINGSGDAANYSYQSSVIQYPPGQLVEAQALARRISGSTQLEQETNSSTKDVYVILGANFVGVLSD